MATPSTIPSTTEKLQVVAFKAPAALVKAIKEAADQTCLSASDICRQGILSYLKSKGLEPR